MLLFLEHMEGGGVLAACSGHACWASYGPERLATSLPLSSVQSCQGTDLSKSNLWAVSEAGL